MKPETITIHGGLEPTPEHGAVSVPIYQSSTFSFDSAEEGASRFSGAPGFKYTRLGNPTVEALARSGNNQVAAAKLRLHEDARKGAYRLNGKGNLHLTIAPLARAILLGVGVGFLCDLLTLWLAVWAVVPLGAVLFFALWFVTSRLRIREAPEAEKTSS